MGGYVCRQAAADRLASQSQGPAAAPAARTVQGNMVSQTITRNVSKPENNFEALNRQFWSLFENK